MAKLSDPEHPGADSPDLDPASRNPRDEEDEFGGVPPRGCILDPCFSSGCPKSRSPTGPAARQRIRGPTADRLWHDSLAKAIRGRHDLTSSQEAMRVLEETSRTFYIPIAGLPDSLREAVTSAYLCMRAIDEVEDHPSLDPSAKAQVLRSISSLLQAQHAIS